jgi:hypothetical protein
MQDEVTKHTRKIYQTMKNRDKGFWEKVREVTIEIFIIVFAVTLSIWLHNWSDHREQRKETAEFLSGLKVDLKEDIAHIEDNRKTFIQQDSTFKFLVDIYNSGEVDTMNQARIGNHFNFQMRTTHFNIARYDGFKSTGKIGAIENDQLKQGILSYYQQTVPAVNDAEALVNGLQEKLMDAQFSKDGKMSMRDFAKSFKALAYSTVLRQNLEDPAIPTYKAAEDEARSVTGMIDEYLTARK